MKKVIANIGILSASAATAFAADTLVAYNFADLPSSFSGTVLSAPSFTETSLVSVSSMSIGPSLTRIRDVASPNFLLRIRPAQAERLTSNQTFANAASGGNFIGFTLTPLEDVSLDLQSISFDLATGGAGTGIRSFWLTQREGTTTTVLGSYTFGWTDSSGVPTATFNGTVTNYTFSLSSVVGLQDRSSPVEFRLYVGGETVNDWVRIDNVSVSGAVAIPEPSSASLLVGGVAVAMVLARRRRHV